MAMSDGEKELRRDTRNQFIATHLPEFALIYDEMKFSKGRAVVADDGRVPPSGPTYDSLLLRARCIHGLLVRCRVRSSLGLRIKFWVENEKAIREGYFTQE